MHRVASAVVLVLLAAPPLRASQLAQTDWRAGPVPGSTTSVSAPWSAYDSQDGAVLLLSTGVQPRQGTPGSWVQTDDGAGEPGFLRTGSAFSSAAVTGTGAEASVTMTLAEDIRVRPAALPDERGDLSAAYHPGTGKTFLIGGVLSDGTTVGSILRYDARNDSLSDTGAFLWGGSSRTEMGSAYHATLDRIFLFGGAAGGAFSSAVFDYVPAENKSYRRLYPLPTPRSGVAAVYHPFTNKIYLFGGQDDTHPYCSDILEFDGMSDAVVAMSTALPSGRAGAAAVYYPPDRRIYIFGGTGAGGDLDEIVAYDPQTDSRWKMNAVLPAPARKLAAVYHPGTQKILLFGGADAAPSAQVLQYDVITDSVVARPVSLPSPRAGTAGVFDMSTNQVFLFGASAGTPADFPQVVEYFSISSGTYRSSIYDTGNLSRLQTMGYSPVSQAAPGLGVSLAFRAGNTPVPDNSWTNHASFTFVANGGTLIPFSPNRYVQYEASLATLDPSTSPVLQDVAIAWDQTPASATLVSTPFDSGIDGDMIRRLSWEGSFPAYTTAQFQLRTAPDGGSGLPGAWGPWLGPTCTTDYYTNAGGSQPINALHADGIDDRWFQYKAILRSSNSFNTATLSAVVVTYDFIPAPPTMASLVADSTIQVTAQWTDNSTNEDLFVLSMGNLPGPTGVSRSTPTADKPGTGGAQTYAIGGLSPNTPYFVRARAYVSPHVDLYSLYSNERNVFTLANPSTSPAITAVYASSITLWWGANSNPSYTPYEVSMSTDGFVTDFSTPVPFGADLTASTTRLMGLSAGTTYYFRVRAQNGNALQTEFSPVVSTQTPPAPLSGFSVSALGVSSITWTWDSCGPASRYRVYNGTIAFQLGDTDQPFWTRVGLSTNAAASIKVQPYTATRAGPMSSALQAYTLAALPGSPRVAGLTDDAVALAWDAAGNPMGTPYEVSLSTDGFATRYSTPVPFSNGLYVAAATLSSLAPGTTYSFRVQARNGDLLATGFDAVLTTPTLPGAVPPPVGVALGVSSITWTWTPSAGPAVDRYAVYRASDASLLALTTSASLLETSLSTDTAYGIRVRAYDSSGGGVLSAGTTIFTLAAPPTGTAITAVHVSSVAIAWDPQGNPSWTAYEVHHSTPGGAYALYLTTGGAGSVPDGLLGGTTHYFRVRAVNGDGLATPFDLQVSTYVYGDPPRPPSGLTAVLAPGSRVRLGWSISPTTTVAYYDIYTDSGAGAIDYQVLFASVSAGTTEYLTGPLQAGTTYLFGVRSLNELGQEEKNDWVVASVLIVASTRPLSAVVLSPPSGSTVAGDRVTLTAGLLQGAVRDVAQILFQVRPWGSAAWADVPAAEARHPNPAVSPPFSTHWDVSGVPAGMYELRAVAKGVSGTADDAPPWFSIRVGPAALADIEERRLAEGRMLKRVRVYSGAPASLVMTDDLTDVVTRVSFSSGALASDQTYLRVESGPPAAPRVPPLYADPRIVRDISLESGQTQLANGRVATIAFSELDKNGDDRVDGTEVRVDNLAIIPYDPASATWRRESASTLSGAEDWTVTGRTPHFSLFAALSGASPDLSAVRVYPVPYKPQGRNPDEGKPWSAGDPTSGLVFDNLTQEGMVKVYTVTGALVWQSGPQNTGGLIRWDANNGDGKEVASGVYFAVISSPGQKPVVRKVVILR